jgi:hypothetical protein
MQMLELCRALTGFIGKEVAFGLLPDRRIGLGWCDPSDAVAGAVAGSSFAREGGNCGYP